MKKIIVCLFFCALLFAENYIKVTGTGEVSFAPNIAYLTIGVQSTYENAQTGQREVNENINKFMNSLQSFVDKKDVETSAISIQRRYEYIAQKQQFVGYDVQQLLKIKLRDFSLIGKVIDKAMSSGFNNISSLVFSHTNPDAYEKEALKKAVEEAQTKAKELAEVSNLKNVKIVDIDETNNKFVPLYDQNPRMMGALQMAGEGATTQVMPGELKTSAVVQMKCTFAGGNL
ncbi:MAG: SIMPL domain-containing protein [Candidatus Margulisbacteria bacterium]|nr:SIMPL domain-containing protein [Candidatus Margulisiibacteriota bacterium]